MTIPADHPHRRLFARLEKQATDDIAAALGRLRRDIMRGINRANVEQIPTRLRDSDINERLRLALYNALLPTAEAAFEVARKELEREVLGIKAITDIGFDWGLVNNAVLEALTRLSFDLSYANTMSLTRSTERQLRRYLDEFIRSDEMTINELAKQLERFWSYDRADQIAITEVTRLFAVGNQTVWRESGVIEKQRWNTAVDELVCPVCSPLNGRVVGLAASWDGIDAPPAHSRCRCWVTPVVEVADDQN